MAQTMYKYPSLPDYEDAMPGLPIPHVALIEATGAVIYKTDDSVEPQPSRYYTKGEIHDLLEDYLSKDDAVETFEQKGVAYAKSETYRKTETYNKSEVDVLIGDIDSALSNI